MQLELKLEDIDKSLSVMRLTRPEQITAMRNSIEAFGQLQPVIVRKQGSHYQLLDGFKRYYALKGLNKDSLQAKIVGATDITAKAMIISYNQQGGSLVDYEEARITYSLKKEHLLNTEEIAGLLLRSHSWVSRRLSFIEKLNDCVQTHLQLGKITPTHARELVKLPRGTQNDFLKLIVDNDLTSRQTAILALKYLQSKTKDEQDYLFKHPLEAIEQQNREAEINDCRLGLNANRLIKTTRLLVHQQHVFIGQSSNPPLNEIPVTELEILAEFFTDVARKTKTILLILKKYDNNER